MTLLSYIDRPVRFMASPLFLRWMSVGWIVYYVFSAILLEEAFGAFATGLSDNPFIQVPFILFLISGYLNFLRALKDSLKKGIIQSALWAMLPLSILIFLTGFFLSLFLRETGQRIIGEGDVIRPPWVAHSLHVSKISPGLKDSLIDADIESGLFSHEPIMNLVDKESNIYKVGVFPPEKIAGTYYHILNFGIAPGMKLFKAGRLEFGGYRPLQVLMPYSSDFFEIQPLPYRFLVSVIPESRSIRDRKEVSEYNLKKPVYHVRVYEGETLIAQGDSKKGVRFKDFALHFTDHTFWVLLEAAKDPAMPLLQIGILLMTIGIPVGTLRAIYKLRPKSDS